MAKRQSRIIANYFITSVSSARGSFLSLASIWATMRQIRAFLMIQTITALAVIVGLCFLLMVIFATLCTKLADALFALVLVSDQKLARW